MLLYLHIPFCSSKCFYCSFCSYSNKDMFKKSYSEAILKQFDMEIEKFNIQKHDIASIFVGGGTPSEFSHTLFKPFMDKTAYYVSPNAEITTEANPNSATPKWLEDMRKLGFNRISFGVQSFNEKKLKFLGRTHSSKEAKNAPLQAKKAGFENISIDLIYDTKLDTKKLLDEDVAIASSLPINHLSAYSLTIEKNTKFQREQNAKKESLALAQYLIKSLRIEGFLQYEISNFSRGYECYHNKKYWEQNDYIGVGCGAVGFHKNRRFYCLETIEHYIENPTSQKIENLSKDDLLLEKIFLSLRSNIGLEIDSMSIPTQNKINILLDEKKGIVKDGKFYNQNYFLSDEIALFLTI